MGSPRLGVAGTGESRHGRIGRMILVVKRHGWSRQAGLGVPRFGSPRYEGSGKGRQGPTWCGCPSFDGVCWPKVWRGRLGDPRHGTQGGEPTWRGRLGYPRLALQRCAWEWQARLGRRVGACRIRTWKGRHGKVVLGMAWQAWLGATLLDWVRSSRSGKARQASNGGAGPDPNGSGGAILGRHGVLGPGSASID